MSDDTSMLRKPLDWTWKQKGMHRPETPSAARADQLFEGLIGQKRKSDHQILLGEAVGQISYGTGTTETLCPFSRFFLAKLMGLQKPQ